MIIYYSDINYISYITYILHFQVGEKNFKMVRFLPLDFGQVFVLDMSMSKKNLKNTMHATVFLQH